MNNDDYDHIHRQIIQEHLYIQNSIYSKTTDDFADLRKKRLFDNIDLCKNRLKQVKEKNNV